MPVYDYVCGSCGHRFEVFHGLNESGPHQCPLCEGSVTRAFVPPTIHFKGSGWAKKDRQSSSGAAARKAAAGSPKVSAPATGAESSGSPGAGGSSGDAAIPSGPASQSSPGGEPTSASSGAGD